MTNELPAWLVAEITKARELRKQRAELQAELDALFELRDERYREAFDRWQELDRKIEAAEKFIGYAMTM